MSAFVFPFLGVETEYLPLSPSLFLLVFGTFLFGFALGFGTPCRCRRCCRCHRRERENALGRVFVFFSVFSFLRCQFFLPPFPQKLTDLLFSGGGTALVIIDPFWGFPFFPFVSPSFVRVAFRFISFLESDLSENLTHFARDVSEFDTASRNQGEPLSGFYAQEWCSLEVGTDGFKPIIYPLTFWGPSARFPFHSSELQRIFHRSIYPSLFVFLYDEMHPRNSIIYVYLAVLVPFACSTETVSLRLANSFPKSRFGVSFSFSFSLSPLPFASIVKNFLWIFFVWHNCLPFHVLYVFFVPVYPLREQTETRNLNRRPYQSPSLDGYSFSDFQPWWCPFELCFDRGLASVSNSAS